MTAASPDERVRRKPLRLWPGVTAVTIQWLARFVLPIAVPGAVAVGIIGGMLGGVAVLVWWLFFSRAPWSERLGAVVVMAAALFATSLLIHESIAGGAMGMLFPILVTPVLSLAFVLWAVATRHLPDTLRRASMVATIFLACGAWALVRTAGFTGDFRNDLSWRWTPTAEERLLARSRLEPAPAAPVISPSEPAAPAPKNPATPTTAVAKDGVEAKAAPPVMKSPIEWPGFRGPRRDSVTRGVSIETDWSASPPKQMWRQEVGPGWSSFAVRGELFYTQEQRGPDEVVACYKLTTGEPVWIHRDAARFWESNAGPGPRSTPTLGANLVYTFGATGIVNALNADDGSLVWSRNAASDVDRKVPDWGFSSSPLLFDDLVIVAASGSLVAYDSVTGAPRWLGPRKRGSYSSPHLLTTDGVPQIILVSGSGVTSVAPSNGEVLWEYAWEGSPIIQPGLTPDGDLLVSVTDSSGIRRLGVAHSPDGWRIEERWTSLGLKPYFNDFVVHKGHAFGFDRSILSCIDLQDGKRKWKGGRYGHGQLVLLPDQDLLLVISEDGELALVRATPDDFRELARVPAIEGKTWNHPVLVRDVLLVRNGEEMAAFRLSRANSE